MTSHILITQEQLEELAKTSAMLSRESHQESVSRLFDDIKNRDALILSKLETIETQVLKTNGRVTCLEKGIGEHLIFSAVMSDRVESHRKILWGGGTTIMGLVLTALIMTILK